MRTHGEKDDFRVDMLLTGEYASVAWLSRPAHRRAWLAPVYHYVRAGRTKKEKDATQARVAEQLAHLVSKKDEIWIGLFREVACYGMERDTARLEVTRNAPVSFLKLGTKWQDRGKPRPDRTG